MAMKGYSAFPKAPALPERQHEIVLCHIPDIHWGGVLPFCREAVKVFYSPSQLGNESLLETYIFEKILWSGGLNN